MRLWVLWQCQNWPQFAIYDEYVIVVASKKTFLTHFRLVLLLKPQCNPVGRHGALMYNWQGPHEQHHPPNRQHGRILTRMCCLECLYQQITPKSGFTKTIAYSTTKRPVFCCGVIRCDPMQRSVTPVTPEVPELDTIDIFL